MTTLYLRGVPDDVAVRVKRAAGARGLTLAEYLAALSGLHRDMLAADPRLNPALAEALDDYGLGPVKE